MADLYFCRELEQTEEEEQAAAEKAMTIEELQDEWPAPAPEFPAAQPEGTAWSEVAGPPCPFAVPCGGWVRNQPEGCLQPHCTGAEWMGAMTVVLSCSADTSAK